LNLAHLWQGEVVSGEFRRAYIRDRKLDQGRRFRLAYRVLEGSRSEIYLPIADRSNEEVHILLRSNQFRQRQTAARTILRGAQYCD